MEEQNNKDKEKLKDFDPAEVEADICRLSEVRAARLVMDENLVEEVHVLASPKKNPKQLARDVEAILVAKYGIPVDHRKISVAMVEKIEETEEPQTVSKNGFRPKILSINIELAGLYSRVAIRLEMEGEEYSGEAEGPASQTGRLRLVALATLNAVEKYVQMPYTFALEDVNILSLGREKVAIACVTRVTSLGEQSFSGSAILKQSDKDAVARAVLDAINRRLGYVTTA
ncbi:MAG: hypothetical protein Q8M92_01105 [Candidatus Subteraquimicrobiales bacterium]|nr:hypothetical protein [Candidatus Subteraquimicrobiales bacterium]